MRRVDVLVLNLGAAGMMCAIEAAGRGRGAGLTMALDLKWT
ncbi:hypothetical protein [Nitratireductor sp. XY-223]|nr:hypothetical protein [Nitratireductor sp. XY-223]